MDVFVGVEVCVEVRVFVGVEVCVEVRVFVGVEVCVCVFVGVCVGVLVSVGVGVLVGHGIPLTSPQISQLPCCESTSIFKAFVGICVVTTYCVQT